MTPTRYANAADTGWVVLQLNLKPGLRPSPSCWTKTNGDHNNDIAVAHNVEPSTSPNPKLENLE